LPVEVKVGADVRGIDIQLLKIGLPRSFRVSGKVTGASPDSEISVGLIPSDGARGGGGVVARPPDYAFELRARQGDYRVLARDYSGAKTAFALIGLTVSGDLDGVVVDMSPPPRVSGRIVLAERDGHVNMKEIRATLRRRPDYPGSAIALRSDAAGNLTFPEPIAPGTYWVEVDRGTIPKGCYLQKVKVGGRDVSIDDFEIITSAELEIVLSNTAGAIAGSVSDGENKAAPGATVTLVSTDGILPPLRQRTNDDGSFRISALRPGKYKLFA
jgi:hypothetical protein